MKKTIFFLVWACIFMASCNEDLFTEDLDSQSKLNLLEKTSDPFVNGKAVTRDLKIHRATGIMVINPENGHVVVNATGNATFLGSFVTHYEFFYGAPETMSGYMMAANGDQINIIYDYEHHMPPIIENNGDIVAYYQITGGTGRFADATGTIMMFGTLSQTTGVFELQGEGEITY